MAFLGDLLDKWVVGNRLSGYLCGFVGRICGEYDPGQERGGSRLLPDWDDASSNDNLHVQIHDQIDGRVRMRQNSKK